MNRARGRNFEREVINAHLDLDIPARRTAMSGGLEEAGDMVIMETWTGEAKFRKRGFKFLAEVLEHAHIAYLREPNDTDFYVVMKSAVYLDLMRNAIAMRKQTKKFADRSKRIRRHMMEDK